MRRHNNLYEQIYNLDNLILAEKKARRGKSKQKGVIEFDKNKNQNLINLSILLQKEEFRTSEYNIFTLYKKKERIIHQLPYYSDRIIHHAVINIIESILVDCFVSNTYNCIKGRGIHKGLNSLRKSLRDKENTKYCLKIDIKKFYPNIDNNILKLLLRKKFKDKRLLSLLDNIIDSTKSVPLGNLLSQYFGNFYLTYFDHWLKEELRVKYIFRYCDDIIILFSNKEYLHNLRVEIQNYLKENLKLILKSNYQIFPVNKRGIDFLGYKSFHNYTRLRKSIKLNYIRMIKKNKNYKSIVSYHGWIMHCEGLNLEKKYLN